MGEHSRHGADMARRVWVSGGVASFLGLLRDMVQNHLLQLESLVAMEPPVSFEAASIRDEKAKVMRLLKPLKESEFATSAVRAKYGAGQMQKQAEPVYRQEEGV